MKRIQLLLILLSIITLNVSGQKGSSNDQNKWNKFEGKRFEIKYPENWQVDTSGKMGTTFIVSDGLLGSSDQFTENVNLLIQDLTGYDMTLDQYAEISTNQIKTLVVDGNILVNERKRGKKYDYQKVIYTGKYGTVELKFEQYYWVVEKEAFVLTFTGESSQFTNYEKIGAIILDSFKIL